MFQRSISGNGYRFVDEANEIFSCMFLIPSCLIHKILYPSFLHQGIIAPKIEISTKTVVEEVLGSYDVNKCHVINPKTINSKVLISGY